ncbi:hypothetical protein CFD26_107788 [Aspergillus turcosus]|uniref:S-adenosyl-L-methionine-dependent methyltransferase n=1 Tax=Aspergillus turcosus TaxID=1245748 RepID=A0A421DGH4_9EURO|nr:hypothetical protein CFD26_107788 [Aspergillus turcosus]
MNCIIWFLGLIQRLCKSIFSPKQRDKNLYSLDHAILHVQTPPPSLWMNMGYWKNETTLAGAAQALLDQVLIAAGLLDPGARPAPHPPQRRFNLLDVGIGCGDQSLHLLNTMRLPRGPGDDDRPLPLFDVYVGVTIAPSQAEMARQRVSSSPSPSPYKAEIFCADAADPSSWSDEMKGALRGMLTPKETGLYPDNWVLALDTLYHFQPSRHPLLSYACRDLRASLMAFDLLLSENASPWERLLLRLVCMLTGVPFSNFLTKPQYEALLVGAGYARDCVLFRDLSDEVFAGLAGFLARKDDELRRFGMSVGKFRGAQTMFNWWARSGVIRGMVIIAKR